MTSAITSTQGSNAASGTSASSSASSTDPTAAQDRFLTLLVAQLNNQDPMNPMDNAQMTSQMAQINTVTGIQQLNQTMKNMSDQFTSLQVLQGASMIGRNVVVESSKLVVANGAATGSVDLADNADNVKIDVLTPGGQVVDSFNLGTQTQGRHSFNWTSATYPNSSDLTFRATATKGGQPVTATPQMQSKVVSVSTGSSGLTLQLQDQSTPVAYSDIRAIL